MARNDRQRQRDSGGRPTSGATRALDDAAAASGLPVDTLSASLLILLSVTAVQRVVGFGRGVLFCRWLDPAELGRWEMAFSFLLLAAPVAVLGLPGSFGRYAEHFRQRGQIRTFLRRVTGWTCALGITAVIAVLALTPQFSSLVFGRSDLRGLVVLVALGLGTIILHHALESLLAALRMFRYVSLLQFGHSVVFAAGGLALLVLWSTSASSILIAYFSASLLTSAGALLVLRSAVARVPADAAPVAHAAFWPKLLRFSLWVWVTNLLGNLFIIVDRYMIVHHSGMDPQQAIAEVGQYHSSRLIPLLLVSVAELLATMVAPHLTHDWEAGNRERVVRRLRLALKLLSFGMVSASVVILSGAGVLFERAFDGKFALGLTVLPWTLCYCGLFGIVSMAQIYLWCAEKVRWCGLPLLVGLFLNIGLNLALLPLYGLRGAVLATVAANAAALLLTLQLIRLAGMRIGPSVAWMAMAPLSVGFGLPWAGVVAAGMVVLMGTTDWLIDSDEKRQLREGFVQLVGRLRKRNRLRRAAATVSG